MPDLNLFFSTPVWSYIIDDYRELTIIYIPILKIYKIMITKVLLRAISKVGTRKILI